MEIVDSNLEGAEPDLAITTGNPFTLLPEIRDNLLSILIEQGYCDIAKRLSFILRQTEKEWNVLQKRLNRPLVYICSVYPDRIPTPDSHYRPDIRYEYPDGRKRTMPINTYNNGAWVQKPCVYRVIIYCKREFQRKNARLRFANGMCKIFDLGTIGFTDLTGLFANNMVFNEPLNHLDVSKVTVMRCMFQQSCYNRPLDKWDTSNVTDISGIFMGAKKFNQDINTWNVSNVLDTKNAFSWAVQFNQPLCSWNTKNVKNMKQMFFRSAFDQDISSWDTSNVTSMEYMFSDTPFNKPLDNWNVSKVRSFAYMFLGCTTFNQPLGKWTPRPSSAKKSMFSEAMAFDQDLSTWNCADTTGQLMVYNAPSFSCKHLPRLIGIGCQCIYADNIRVSVCEYCKSHFGLNGLAPVTVS